MKTNFKQLALAGSVAALAGASIPAQAIIVGAPGEAALVPFAVYTNNGQAGSWDFNTLVRVTVPSQLGNDVIQNCYTAPHVSPGNTAQQGCNVLQTGLELPSEIATNNTVHWYFLDQRSVHRLNGTFPVTADDTYLFNWEEKASGQLPGTIGYLLFVNENAANGGNAQFAFNTDAYLTFELNNGLAVDEYSDEIVWIPSLPMADGADAGATQPTLANNVVEYMGGQLVLEASPLVAGERTIWADGILNNYVFDLPLAVNQNDDIAAANDTPYLQQGTIAVVWNDRNVDAPWTGMVAYRYNNNEQRCSGNISLPDELNLLYIPRQSQEGNASVTDPRFAGFPGAWQSLNEISPYSSASSEAGSSFAATTGICNTRWDVVAGNANAQGTAPGNGNNGYSDYGVDGGFVKIVAVEPADPATFTPEGAAVMFTIPVLVDGRAPAQFQGWPTGQTMLGHSRGAFSTIN